MIHELPKLPYSYESLEPHIDAKTMEIHHTKHHQAYVDKLNGALKDYPDLQLKTLEELIKFLDSAPSKIRKAIRNNAGGHFSHSLFWKIMGPKKGGQPQGRIAGVIRDKFGSFEKFKNQFSKKALNLFGSGWVWLVLDKNNKLKIISSSGHNNPLMKNLAALLVIDVWEHAYYLKYQNRRAEYIDAWWNVVNWDEVESNYQKAIL